MDSALPGETPRTPANGCDVSLLAAPDLRGFDSWTHMLNVQQVADQLGIGKTKIYELLDRGEIRSLRIGAARRIPRAALAEFVFRHLGEMDPSRGLDVTPVRDGVAEDDGRTPARTLGASAGLEEQR